MSSPSCWLPNGLSLTMLIPGNIYAESFLLLLLGNQDLHRVSCSCQVSAYIGWFHAPDPPNCKGSWSTGECLALRLWHVVATWEKEVVMTCSEALQCLPQLQQFLLCIKIIILIGEEISQEIGVYCTFPAKN